MIYVKSVVVLFFFFSFNSKVESLYVLLKSKIKHVEK